MKIELFVPGRLCLFGEHTDWAGKYRTMNADIVPGASIVTGIEQGIYAEVEKSSIFEMYSEAPEIKDVWQDFACKMSEQELKTVAKSGSFFCYCAGVASYMLEWYHVGGVKITLKSMTLPMKSGLSSSAAIRVMTEPQRIVEGLVKLFKMSDIERREIGNNGYNLVKRDYTWEGIADKTLHLYRWLLNEGDKPGFVYLD